MGNARSNEGCHRRKPVEERPSVKKCDIVIPVWNELEYTRNCVESVKKNTKYPYRLIVIDNASSGPTEEYLRSMEKAFPELLLIRNKANLGFVKAVNQGMSASGSPYMCLLNNDTLVTDNWLTFMVSAIESGPENIGIANPTSNVFGKKTADGKKGQWQELDSCRGFCMVVKKEVIEKIGLLDEIYGMGYFEEKDFSRRAFEAGYISVRVKSSFVFHKDRVSFDRLGNRNEIFRRNEAIYDKKWGKPLNIAFAAREKGEFQKDKALIYELLAKGHRIHLFFASEGKPGRFKDHINIKYFHVPQAFFKFSVLFKLWERRHKKKIDFLSVKNDNARKFFDRFKFMHKAEVKCTYP